MLKDRLREGLNGAITSYFNVVCKKFMNFFVVKMKKVKNGVCK